MIDDRDGFDQLREAARRIANAFLTLDPAATVGAPVRSALEDEPVDLVSVGKASPTMAAAVTTAGVRVRRQIVICDERSAAQCSGIDGLHVGDHPVTGARSFAAAKALLQFLRVGGPNGTTVFLVSGGGSSLCAMPAPPVELDDLRALWRGALEAGLNIGELNTVRTATSAIAGGAIRRYVRTARSFSFVAVDNLVTGASGTSSGLTYDTVGDTDRVRQLLERTGVGADVRDRFCAAVTAHNALLDGAPPPHENVVVADPTLIRDVTMQRAREEGFVVIDAGILLGDVHDAAATVSDALASAPLGRVCVVGVGEPTVEVTTNGEGGRCQQLALIAARRLARLSRVSVLVARATDGQDHLAGVGGAWVDSTTTDRAHRCGVDLDAAIARCESHRALASLDQLIVGEPTGWNLCDVVVVCASA